jgi:hypothetical protein
VTGHRVLHSRVDDSGKVTLRSKAVLFHIGLGRSFARQRVVLLVAGLDVRVLNLHGELIRRLTLDESQSYQRQP